MILGHDEIHNRLTKGEVFRRGTWDPGCVKEASYVLRIAADGLLLDGKFYEPFNQEKRNWFQKLTEPRNYIQIDPGKIAILSTLEELNMPSNLVDQHP